MCCAIAPEYMTLGNDFHILHLPLLLHCDIDISIWIVEHPTNSIKQALQTQWKGQPLSAHSPYLSLAHHVCGFNKHMRPKKRSDNYLAFTSQNYYTEWPAWGKLSVHEIKMLAGKLARCSFFPSSRWVFCRCLHQWHFTSLGRICFVRDDMDSIKSTRIEEHQPNYSMCTFTSTFIFNRFLSLLLSRCSVIIGVVLYRSEQMNSSHLAIFIEDVKKWRSPRWMWRRKKTFRSCSMSIETFSLVTKLAMSGEFRCMRENWRNGHLVREADHHTVWHRN